jgi:hypothetical protein
MRMIGTYDQCPARRRDAKVPAAKGIVSQNRYSAALDPFQEFAVRLSVYGKVCFGPPFLEYPIGRLVLFS